MPQNKNTADESYEPPPVIMSRITKEDLDILVDITTEGISPVKYQIKYLVEDLCPNVPLIIQNVNKHRLLIKFERRCVKH